MQPRVVRPLGAAAGATVNIANLALVGEQGQGDGYALRADATYSVLDIARAFGGEIEMVEGYPGRQDVADDPTRARDELGWKPTLDVMDYIRELTARQRS